MERSIGALSRIWIAFLVTCGILAVPSDAVGEDEIVATRDWRQVAFSEVESCRVQILGNGEIFRIGGVGFRPGEVVRLRIVNTAMQAVNNRIKPVSYSFTVRSDGTWREFHVPIISNRSGGQVTVSLANARCNHLLGFRWEKPSL